MREDERLWAVKELLSEYVKSPSLRHIRDPYSIARLAKEIVKRIDQGNSIWRKWDGQRELLLKSALPCWIPIDDLREFLNAMPGPPLTATDVSQRLQAFEEEEHYFFPKEEFQAGCLAIGATRVASESPIIPGDFLHRLIQVGLLVVSVASSVFVAMSVRRKLIGRRTWAASSSSSGSFLSYLTVGITSFFTSATILLVLNLPSASVLVALQDMIHLVMIYSFAPAAAGVLTCVWLDRLATNDQHSSIRRIVVTAFVLAMVAGVAALIFVSDPRKKIPFADANLFIVISAIQYLISGIVVAMLAKTIHSADKAMSASRAFSSSATVTEFPSDIKSA
jgi:hypothetical protein